jgi:hypothetical protein
MLLEGSCHCGAVKFSVASTHPEPYQRCYCGICRKAGGGGGFLVHIEADATTLSVEGEADLETYRAVIVDGDERRVSAHQRKFCRKCGCHLYAFNERWPELLHPVAGAIDTPLPEPPELVHLMLGSKPAWVRVEGTPNDGHFDEYPEESLAAWHEKRGLVVD